VKGNSLFLDSVSIGSPNQNLNTNNPVNLTLTGPVLASDGKVLINPADLSCAFTTVGVPCNDNQTYITSTMNNDSVFVQTIAKENYFSILQANDQFSDIREIGNVYMEFGLIDTSKPFYAWQVKEKPILGGVPAVLLPLILEPLVGAAIVAIGDAITD
jgi:hypothetical protein